MDKRTLLWGFAATLVLTTSMRLSQALQLTRLDIPYLLGTGLTSDRDRAKIIGTCVHFLNGWLLSFLYAASFQALGRATIWLGGLMGLLHAAFVLVIVVPGLPAVHPRMASETRGPDPTRLLEPPGFLALNYGKQTPAVTIAAHVVYGMILGGLCRA